MIKERRPCVHVCSRCRHHMCAKLCMTCAASGNQVSLLLAATLRSVNGPGASMAPGQAAARAASFASRRRPGTRGAHRRALGWSQSARRPAPGKHRSRAGAERAPARQEVPGRNVVSHIGGKDEYRGRWCIQRSNQIHALTACQSACDLCWHAAMITRL